MRISSHYVACVAGVACSFVCRYCFLIRFLTFHFDLSETEIQIRRLKTLKIIVAYTAHSTVFGINTINTSHRTHFSSLRWFLLWRTHCKVTWKFPLFYNGDNAHYNFNQFWWPYLIFDKFDRNKESLIKTIKMSNIFEVEKILKRRVRYVRNDVKKVSDFLEFEIYFACTRKFHEKKTTLTIAIVTTVATVATLWMFYCF